MSNSGCEQAAGQERSHAWNNQQTAVETGTRMRADQTAVRKRCLLANEEKGRRKILAGKEKQIWCYSLWISKIETKNPNRRATYGNRSAKRNSGNQRRKR
jgi:hypothetical protein